LKKSFNHSSASSKLVGYKKLLLSPINSISKLANDLSALTTNLFFVI
jgi:hypothetical protein